MVYVEGDQDNGHSKPSMRAIVLRRCMSSGAAPKINCDLPQPCIIHMQHTNEANRKQRSERAINFSQPQDTMRRVVGSFV